MKVLFVKHSLDWPLSRGHDVYSYYMMKALGRLGHEVYLATSHGASPEALGGLDLRAHFHLDDGATPTSDITLAWLHRRMQSYYRVVERGLSVLRERIALLQPDAVIGVAVEGLAYLPAADGTVRVWYPGDELALSHFSQCLCRHPAVISNVRQGAMNALYERSYARFVDRVWVVSEEERRAMRWVAGIRTVDVLPIGVDTDVYRPNGGCARQPTAVFWGRLDAAPNVQALEWFCDHVWPSLIDREPNARFTIIGFSPSERVARLGRQLGVEVVPDVPDLSHYVLPRSVAVLPFVSGSGSKNKLLEAAALGVPIVCTARAARGLRAPWEAPLIVTDGAASMSDAVAALWTDTAHCDRLAQAARQWVIRHHPWESSARVGIDAIAESLEQARNGH